MVVLGYMSRARTLKGHRLASLAEAAAQQTVEAGV